MNSGSHPVLNSLKLWARSGSWNYAVPHSDGQVRCFRWKGTPLYFRSGTSDRDLIHRILLKPEAKREYHFPRLEPKVVFDIGANIGATSVLLAKTYPNARLYSFEPEPANFEILKKNLATFPNATAVPLALGNRTETRRFYLTEDLNNRGGFSSYYQGQGEKEEITLRVKSVEEFLREQEIASVEVIKIDTEGAEHEILTAFPPQVLQTCRFMTGELHGEKNFELMSYLEQWFQVGMRKSWFSRIAVFDAWPHGSRP